MLLPTIIWYEPNKHLLLVFIIVFPRLRLRVERKIYYFLYQTTMTVSRATLCSTTYHEDEYKRVLLLYASVYDTEAKTKIVTAAETKPIT